MNEEKRTWETVVWKKDMKVQRMAIELKGHYNAHAMKKVHLYM
jgi:hypothetical protein